MKLSILVLSMMGCVFSISASAAPGVGFWCETDRGSDFASRAWHTVAGALTEPGVPSDVVVRHAQTNMKVSSCSEAKTVEWEAADPLSTAWIRYDVTGGEARRNGNLYFLMLPRSGLGEDLGFSAWLDILFDEGNYGRWRMRLQCQFTE